MFYEKINLEIETIVNQIRQLEQKIKGYPKGELYCEKNNKYIKWHCKVGKKRKYIPKKNRSFAEQMMEKKYLTSQLEDLKHEKMALEAYLTSYTSYVSKVENMLTDPRYNELMSQISFGLSDEIMAWMKEEYTKNPYHPDGKKYKSLSGNILRSKSEMMIDQALYVHRIPFRYECELILNGKVIYPDFIIRHPVTGAFFIWEHFGLIDNPSYSQKTLMKLETYIANRYYPTINLITTFETKDHPLDSSKIEEVIRTYFS